MVSASILIVALFAGVASASLIPANPLATILNQYCPIMGNYSGYCDVWCKDCLCPGGSGLLPVCNTACEAFALTKPGCALIIQTTGYKPLPAQCNAANSAGTYGICQETCSCCRANLVGDLAINLMPQDECVATCQGNLVATFFSVACPLPILG